MISVTLAFTCLLVYFVYSFTCLLFSTLGESAKLGVGDDGRNAAGGQRYVRLAGSDGGVPIHLQVHCVTTRSGAGVFGRHSQPRGVGGERVGGGILVVEREPQQRIVVPRAVARRWWRDGGARCRGDGGR